MEVTLLGDEHTELRWFKPAVAKTLSGLALEEHRPLFQDMIRAARLASGSEIGSDIAPSPTAEPCVRDQ
jgi:hypothetical protein